MMTACPALSTGYKMLLSSHTVVRGFSGVSGTDKGLGFSAAAEHDVSDIAAMEISAIDNADLMP